MRPFATTRKLVGCAYSCGITRKSSCSVREQCSFKANSPPVGQSSAGRLAQLSRGGRRVYAGDRQATQLL